MNAEFVALLRRMRWAAEAAEQYALDAEDIDCHDALRDVGRYLAAVEEAGR